MWRNRYYRLRSAAPDRVWRPPHVLQATPHYKTRPPPAAFTASSFLLPRPSFSRPPFGLRPSTASYDRLVAAPTTRSVIPHHTLPSQKISRSTAPPSPLDSSARPGALLMVSEIADSWNLLEPTCLVMDTASMLTRSREPGVCRHARSQTIAQKAPIQFYDLATQLMP